MLDSLHTLANQLRRRVINGITPYGKPLLEIDFTTESPDKPLVT